MIRMMRMDRFDLKYLSVSASGHGHDVGIHQQKNKKLKFIAFFTSETQILNYFS